MKKIVKVYGIDCLNCKIKLESALETLEGLTAEVDMEKAVVLLDMEKVHSDEAILQKIAEVGYDAIII